MTQLQEQVVRYNGNKYRVLIEPIGSDEFKVTVTPMSLEGSGLQTIVRGLSSNSLENHIYKLCGRVERKNAHLS